MEPRYDVVLSGSPLPGFKRADVVASLAQLIDRDDELIEQLLADREVTLRTDVSLDDAVEALGQLRAVGASATMQEHRRLITAGRIEVDADLDGRVQRLARDDDRPRLWNVIAIGVWSVILTPVFGAFLVRRNWLALGDVAQARVAKRWLVGNLVTLIALLFVQTRWPHTFNALLVAHTMIWFTLGAYQQKVRVDQLGGRFRRRSWFAPLVGGFVGIVAIVVCVGMTFGIFAQMLDQRMANQRLEHAIAAPGHPV